MNHLSSHWSWPRLLLLVLTLCATRRVEAAYQSPVGGTAGTSQAVCYSHWQSVGPFAVAHQYSGNNGLDDPQDIGALSSVWISPSTATAYVGAVNGGVWKSSSYRTYNSFNGPHWVPVSDQMDCLSISSVSGSATDSNLIVAGCGFFSNSAQRGGEARGVMISTNAGSTWSMTGFPKGYKVTAVAAIGTGSTASILVAASSPVFPVSGTTGQAVDSYGVGTSATGGLWRSSNGGVSFTKIIDGVPVRVIVAHPTTPTTVYVALLQSPDGTGAFAGVVEMSTNSGASFTATASDPDILNECPNSGTLVSASISVSIASGVTYLYAAFYIEDANQSPCMAFFYSTNNGASWTTIANQPNPSGGLNLGSQGLTNFAVFSPPTVANTMFVAATGRVVFRVAVNTNTWTVISSPQIDPSSDAPSYQTTASSTAPHSDARQFAWDSTTSELLLTNDGGLYKRTSPLGTPSLGDWISLAGDLSISEFYQVAFDPRSGAMIAGAQDNALFLSQFDGTEKSTGIWNYFTTGDGTTVAVNTVANPAIFYGSNQFLATWFRVNVLGGTSVGVGGVTDLSGTSFGSCQAGTDTCLDYTTTQAINSVDPTKMLICTDSTAATDLCYSVSLTTSTPAVTALEFNSKSLGLGNAGPHVYVFGGKQSGTTNANVIFAVGDGFVWSRSTVCATASCISKYSTGVCNSPCNIANAVNTNPPWSGKNTVTLVFIAQHPNDYTINLVADDAGHSWLTRDFGRTFLDLNLNTNSNLLSLSGHTSVDTFGTGAAIFVNTVINGVYPLIIATTYGVFVSFSPIAGSSFTFVKLGANLPRTIVSSFTYSPSTDTLILSMFGRGIFALQSASQVLQAAANGQSTTTLNSACVTGLYPNVAGAYGYTSTPAAPIGFPSSSSSTGGALSSTAVAASSTASVVSSTAAVASSTASVVSSSSIASSTAAAKSSSASPSSTASAPSSTASAASSTASAVSSTASTVSSTASLASSTASVASSTAKAASSSSIPSSSAVPSSTSATVVSSSTAGALSSSAAKSSSAAAPSTGSAPLSSTAAVVSSTASVPSSTAVSSTGAGTPSSTSVASSSAKPSSTAAPSSTASVASSTAAAVSSTAAAASSTAAIISSTAAASSSAVASSTAASSTAGTVASSTATLSSSAGTKSSSTASVVSSTASAQSSTASVPPSSTASSASSTASAVTSSTSSRFSSTAGVVASSTAAAFPSSTATPASSSAAASSAGSKASSTAASVSSSTGASSTATSASSTAAPAPSSSSSAGASTSSSTASSDSSTASSAPSSSSSGAATASSTADSSSGSGSSSTSTSSSTGGATSGSSTGSVSPSGFPESDVSFVFSMTYSLDSLPGGSNFGPQICLTLQQYLGITNRNRLSLLSVTSGSVVVRILISGAQDSSEELALDIASQLSSDMSNPNSTLFSYGYLQNTVAGSATSQGYVPASGNTPSDGGSKVNLPLIIGVSVGGGIILLIAVSLYLRVSRRRKYLEKMRGMLPHHAASKGNSTWESDSAEMQQI